MTERPKPLAGLLWLRAAGHDFSLPLTGVRRVALCNQLRSAQGSPAEPAWWGGVTIEDERPHALINLAELIGLEPDPMQLSTENVVVMSSLWSTPVGLVCDRFRGIIPESATSWGLAPALFASAEGAFPRVRLWEGRVVIDLAVERLFNAPRRAQFDQTMKNSKENVDQLWELSELEQRLASAPTAQGYRDLAVRYRKLGWVEDAERMQALAAEVKTAAPAARPATGGLSGPFNGRVLLEVIHVLHATGRSGELLLDAPGAITAAVSFSRGTIVDVKSADAEEPVAALRKLAAIPAGRYQFFAGAPATGESRVATDTAALIAELEQPLLSTP